MSGNRNAIVATSKHVVMNLPGSFEDSLSFKRVQVLVSQVVGNKKHTEKVKRCWYNVRIQHIQDPLRLTPSASYIVAL